MSDPKTTLLDRDEIRELRYRFGWALDTRDWELFASLFTETVEVDLPAFGASATSMPRDGVVELFQQPFGLPIETMGTQQLYGNPVVEIDGEKAVARWYLLGHHHVAGLEGGENVELRAVYTDRLVRTVTGWRIYGIAVQVQSMVGNLAIFA